MKFFRYLSMMFCVSITVANAAQQAPQYIVDGGRVPQVNQSADLGNNTILRRIVDLAFDQVIAADSNMISQGATQLLNQIDQIANVDCRQIVTEVFWSKVCLAYVLKMVKAYTFADAQLCTTNVLYNNVTTGLAANNQMITQAALANNAITFVYRNDMYRIDIHATITHISNILTHATVFVQNVVAALGIAGSALLQAPVIRVPNTQPQQYITLSQYMNNIQDLCQDVAQQDFLARVNQAVGAFAHNGGTFSNTNNRTNISGAANTRLKDQLNQHFIRAAADNG